MATDSGFCRKRSLQTGSSGTVIGYKSGQTTNVPLWGPNGVSVAMDSGRREGKRGTTNGGDDFWNMGEEALRLHGFHSWCPEWKGNNV